MYASDTVMTTVSEKLTFTTGIRALKRFFKPHKFDIEKSMSKILLKCLIWPIKPTMSAGAQVKIMIKTCKMKFYHIYYSL